MVYLCHGVYLSLARIVAIEEVRSAARSSSTGAHFLVNVSGCSQGLWFRSTDLNVTAEMELHSERDKLIRAWSAFRDKGNSNAQVIYRLGDAYVNLLAVAAVNQIGGVTTGLSWVGQNARPDASYQIHMVGHAEPIKRMAYDDKAALTRERENLIAAWIAVAGLADQVA